VIIFLGLVGPIIVVGYSLYKFFVSTTRVVSIDEGGYIILVEKWGEVALPTKIVVNAFTLQDLINRLVQKFHVR
jgi:hypothetical protein